MNMVGMNVGAGGPVGGMMNNGGPGTPSNANSTDTQRTHLNTCIYDYFLKLGMYDFARMLLKDSKFDIKLLPPGTKPSPGRRKDGEMNGVDGDVMDMDGDIKNDLPDDLPLPHLPAHHGAGQGFLIDWFCVFSDLFSAQRNRNEASTARTYLNQTQSLQRMRETQQNINLPRQSMQGIPVQQMAAMRNMQNGMVNGNTLSKSLTPQQMQQINAQQQIMRAKQQMREQQGDMDMNGRPGTPADGDNGGSPSKRQRLNDPQFNGAMGPNGRIPGMPGAQNQQMLMQAGFQPNMNPQFRPNAAAMQQKAMQGQMGNAMMMQNMANAGSPMLGPMGDAQFGANGMPGEMFNQRMPGPGMQGPAGGQGGNHALQDYQMQLMLLEQQNKKRLMMARQEQDSIGKAPDGSTFPGQVGMQQGMSPNGSRSGPSPNPTDQMKRGTPQLGGLPGSPAPGDNQGRSPGMNFMGGDMGQGFNAALMMKDNGFAGAMGPGMQPPGMNMANMANMARAQAARMPGQFSGGQPMVQQTSQGQQQPTGTPGQRNEMPPPQAPVTGGPNANRNQPSSPQQNQAPPTPSTANKANPKKKGKEGDNKKKANKKNSTANASSEAEPPATPTPSTPITPHPPNNFNGSAGKGGLPGQGNMGPTSNPVPLPAPTMSNDMGPAFGFEAPDTQYNLDFSALDGGDVLENFDFDSFLNNNGTGDDFTFDSGALGDFPLDPGVE